jgi:hypothetical protein
MPNSLIPPDISTGGIFNWLPITSRGTGGLSHDMVPPLRKDNSS